MNKIIKVKNGCWLVKGVYMNRYELYDFLCDKVFEYNMSKNELDYWIKVNDDDNGDIIKLDN